MGLFKSKLPQKGRPLRSQEKDALKDSLIIFVLGGPCCGKGIQCRNMATRYGLYYLSLGQLLRQEAQRSTWQGRKIQDIMLRGHLVPTVGRTPNAVIVFDCSMATMVRRALQRYRVEGRVDQGEGDCGPALHRRLETHYTCCPPVLTFYQQQNLLRNDSEPASALAAVSMGTPVSGPKGAPCPNFPAETAAAVGQGCEDALQSPEPRQAREPTLFFPRGWAP
ncbi:adenylate kinase isoenzyme 1-like [Octodon degus]|uniref:Adenylate kinase isoenzyme 1-like n=1 Tax=Octodon degus TaxID=10160 RepID=A0A6P6EKT9_OCTDE|nr:adenylate kinase isoenzyme 1-like [Octodon degus]